MANVFTEREAQEILEYLTKGLDFSIPNVDFNAEAFKIPDGLATALQHTPKPPTLEELTERIVNGNGVFDAIMTAMKAHIKEEFEANRITGAEYSKTYTAMLQYALQYAVQYLLERDRAYYAALGAQAQALSMNIDAYTAKVRLAIAQAQAHLHKAQYANEVLKLGMIDKQTEQTVSQTALVDAQTECQKQQRLLLIEQTEQAHAQVSDTRLDGKTKVTGYTGHQNTLLAQQAQAFRDDHVLKGTKVFADSFATQLSMSTATVAGTGLDANGINKAISALQETITRNKQLIE